MKMMKKVWYQLSPLLVTLFSLTVFTNHILFFLRDMIVDDDDDEDFDDAEEEEEGDDDEDAPGNYSISCLSIILINFWSDNDCNSL